LLSKEKELLKHLEKQRYLAFLRYKSGKTPYLDILHFDSQVSQEKAMLSKVKTQLRLAKELLALTIGLKDTSFQVKGTLDGGDLLKEPFFQVKPSIFQRPDVKEALLGVKKAETGVEMAKSSFLPEVYLFGSYGYKLGSGLKPSEKLWTFGIGLKFNLFSSGEKIYALYEKEQSLLSAKSNFRAVLLKAQEAILSAKADVNAARSEISYYEAAVKFAREAYFKELSSHDKWLKTELALLKAKFELKKALINYQVQTAQILKNLKGCCHENS